MHNVPVSQTKCPLGVSADFLETAGNFSIKFNKFIQRFHLHFRPNKI